MIPVARSMAEWRERRRALEDCSIGFVPTMGALHAGHASLIERARGENEVVVASIFVNPTQFNDPADLARYPRDLERDLALLESAGCDEVLAPSVADLYPEGYGYRVEPPASELVLEGAFRPGHFAGVLTVVLKLLNLVRPARAYFGEKDFQQLSLVAAMVRDLFLPVEIIACPTVREPSGLAMSSRNALLSADGRFRAAGLHRVLAAAAGPECARAELAALGFAVEYVEERWGRRLAAAVLEGVRLIDNIPVPER